MSSRGMACTGSYYACQQTCLWDTASTPWTDWSLVQLRAPRESPRDVPWNSSLPKLQVEWQCRIKFHTFGAPSCQPIPLICSSSFSISALKSNSKRALSEERMSKDIVVDIEVDPQRAALAAASLSVGEAVDCAVKRFPILRTLE